MNFKKIAACMLSVCIFVHICVLGVSAQESTLLPWSQTVIDGAVSEVLATAGINDLTKNPPILFSWKSTLRTTSAMYMLALMSYHNPDLKSTSGTKVSTRFLAHIRNIIKGGNEPSCVGGLGGWVDNPVAQSLLLAKNTPSVWGSLTTAEKEKCDFIMKAMTVVGNYTMNYYTNPKTDMSQITWWEKGWNPNHVEGYIGVMIAAHIYFGGADAVNSILRSFNYDQYISTMNSYGYVNMKYCYTQTGGPMMESGGIDPLDGTVVGVKRDFEYKDILTGAKVEYTPMALYRSLALRMYYHPCQSKVYDYDGKTLIGYITDGTTSPYEGKTGMGYELISSDANGRRTSTEYVFLGWRNNVITRSVLQSLGLYEGSYARELQLRMYIGTEDFIYKAKHGYTGHSNGKQLNNIYESNFTTNGYTFYKEIWDKYLKPSSFIVTTGLTKNGSTLTGTVTLNNNFTGEEKTVVAYLNIYQGNKLKDIITKTYTVADGIEEAKNTFTATLPAGCSAKLMVWDAEGNMTPLADTKTIQ